jgi:hypothetical protein
VENHAAKKVLEASITCLNELEKEFDGAIVILFTKNIETSTHIKIPVKYWHNLKNPDDFAWWLELVQLNLKKNAPNRQ